MFSRACGVARALGHQDEVLDAGALGGRGQRRDAVVGGADRMDVAQQPRVLLRVRGRRGRPSTGTYPARPGPSHRGSASISMPRLRTGVGDVGHPRGEVPRGRARPCAAAYSSVMARFSSSPMCRPRSIRRPRSAARPRSPPTCTPRPPAARAARATPATSRKGKNPRRPRPVPGAGRRAGGPGPRRSRTRTVRGPCRTPRGRPRARRARPRAGSGRRRPGRAARPVRRARPGAWWTDADRRTDGDPLGAAQQVPGERGRGRAQPVGDEVVLGDPDAVETGAFGGDGGVDRTAQHRRRRSARETARPAGRARSAPWPAPS